MRLITLRKLHRQMRAMALALEDEIEEKEREEANRPFDLTKQLADEVAADNRKNANPR